MLLSLVVVGVLAWMFLNPAPQKPDDPIIAAAETKTEWVSDLVAAENLILKLTIELDALNSSIKKLELPSAEIGAMFAGSVLASDISADLQPRDNYETLATETFDYSLSESKSIERSELKIWHPLLEELKELRDAKFYFVSGQFSDESRNEFESKMGFEGLAQKKTGEWVSIHANQDLTWVADPEIDEDDMSRWTIGQWEQTKMHVERRSELMFEDVFATAIPKEDQVSLLVSAHDEFITRLVNNEPMKLPYPQLDADMQTHSTTRHPAVSVVDVNGDGWDDFFVTTRWHKSRLFVNQQDGTFKNQAKEYGLELDLVTCALFADFDNDGDKDVFLGRSYSDSLLMINEDGKFSDQTKENIKEPLPGFVTSVSAADFNNDGLLDLYLSTYVSIGVTVQSVESASRFMPVSDAEELMDLFMECSPADTWLNRPGPPNRLLENKGNGKFEKSYALQEVWMNTFQSCWSDFDEDGDVDLYLSNDFAPDFLFRNNGQRGFEDITQSAGGDAMRGFGMGVSWGDYDNDGRQDLYVSNMYSKAGKRIIGQVPNELDPRYLMSANGNRLFKNIDENKFDLVSGEGSGELNVNKAGWSWGGQFCDFDNDGFLDIYVSSGFYTAPKEVSCNIDM